MIQKRHDKRPSGTQELGEIDKRFATASPARVMVTCVHHVWMALESGVEVRNARTTELVHEWNVEPSRDKVGNSTLSLLAVTIQSRGPQVWMGLSSGSVEVYDAQSFAMVRQMNKHAGGVYCLAEFGGYVYSGGSDFKIVQWGAEDGRLIRVLHGHTNYVRCLYAEGNAVVSGSDDCTVRVWDAGSGEAQLTGHFHGRAGVSALCRVGVTMWSGDNDGRVIAWKLNTCEALRVLHAHGGRVASLRKIGSRVYSGGADGIIAVFDAEDGQLVQRIEDHRGARITALVGPSELRRFCIWSCGTDNKVRCWYQDEYVPMTDDQERFTEGFWYLTGSTPYREFRESVLRQNKFLRDKLIVAEKQNTRMMDLLSFFNASLTPSHMQKREASTMEEYRLAKERLEIVENELQNSKKRLQTLDTETRTVLELLRVAQAELGVLDFSALKSLSVAQNNVATGVSGANTVQLSQPVTTSTEFSGGAMPLWGSSVPGIVRLPPVLREGSPSGGVGATPNALLTTGTPHPSSVPHYSPPAQSFAQSLGKPPQPSPATTQPLGGTGVTVATPQPFSATTQPLGGTGVTVATPQPFSATTQPLGGTGVTVATSQPFSATTQPLGGTGVTVATPQPFSATTQPLGGTGVTVATPQPFSATTQPLGGTGVTVATPQPFSATTQPLGGTGVTVATSQPFSATTQPLGGTGVTVATPQPFSATTQPLGGTGVTVATPQPFSATTQPLGGTGVTVATSQPFSATTQPLGGTGVTVATSQPFSATTQPLGGTGVTVATPQPFSATTQPLGGTGVTVATPQPFSATTQPLGGTGVTVATPQPFSATTQPLGGTGVTVATPQPFSATTQPLGGTGVTVATQQPFSATTQPLGGTGVTTATYVSPSGIQAARFSSPVPAHNDALLEVLAQAGAVEDASSWKGVEWTNKNVGHYIQRRFYGGEPSLRAPELEKRRARKKKLPKIRVIPLNVKKGPGEVAPTSP